MAQLARDEAGHVWDVSDPAHPVLAQQAPQSPVQMMGGITLKTPNTLEVQGKTLGNQKSGIEVQKDSATLPYDISAAKSKSITEGLVAKTAQEAYDVSHPKADGSEALSGPAYMAHLHQVDPGKSAYIQGLVEGRVPFPGPVMMKTPAGQALMMQVMRADPTIDATNYATRAAERKNAAVGKLSDSDNAIVTALGHAQRLATLVPEVFGTPVHAINSIANAVDGGVLGGKQPAYDQNATKLGQEVAAVYGGGTGGERNAAAGEFGSNLSTGQKMDNIHGAVDLMMSKLAANRAKFAYGNGNKPDFMLLPKDTRDALAQLAPPGSLDKYFSGVQVMPDGSNGGGGTPPGGPNGSIAPGGPQTSAASGPIKSTYSPRLSAQVDAMVNAGAGVGTINAVLKKQGEDGITPASYAAARKYTQDTGKPYFGSNMHHQDSLNIGQQIAGSAIGAGLAHMADAATAGTVGALSGEQGRGALDAMAAMHPDASVTGDVVGGITGAGGAEMAAAKMAPVALAKYAPRMADAIYGGLSGFNAAGDGQGASGALQGAALGAAGGVAGEYGMKALGGLLKGVANPSARYLRSQGVPLTAGQAGGGFLKSIEDAMTSIPGAGNMIDARRREGLQAFAKSVGQQAVDPINGVGPGYGEAAVNDLLRQGGAAYDAATAGAHVPLSAQAIGQLGDARAMGASLPDDLAARFGKAMDNRVNPILDAGAMTGDTYQQAMRGLKSYRAEAPNPGFEQDYRNALSGVMGTLKGNMVQGGGADVVQNLAKADEAWKNIKVFQKATQAAKNGTGGDLGLPMPSQFNNAAQQAANKFGGDRPMGSLIDEGQSVLPSKLPDSGTAKRLLVGGLLSGGLGGTGALAGGDNPLGGAATGSELGLGATLALMAGGTKTGQKLLVKTLMDRPDIAIHLGNALGGASRYGGILGAAAGTRLPPFSVSP